MTFTFRAITADEIAVFRENVARGFGVDARHEDGAEDRTRALIDPSRAICAFDGSDLVGTLGTFPFEVTIPGGAAPMAGTTMVTVRPTHRRRGALTGMMRGHHDEVLERGEPLAGLWASESSIYARYGYGHAADGYDVTLDGDRIEMLEPQGSHAVRYLIDEAERDRVVPEIHERVRRQRPGILSRSPAWWENRVFWDPEWRRDGKSARRYAVVEGAGGPEGYAAFRQKEKWSDFPEGEVHVVEVFSENREAHLALWHFLTNVDLFPKVTYWNMPVDDILPWCVRESRRVIRKPGDSLWIRVMNVPAALTARSYLGSGRLNLRIRDRQVGANEGTWALDASPDGATCEPTTAAPDLEMDVESLGALYLGGHRVDTLARAGRIDATPGAAALADSLFRWHRAPWCPEVF